MKLGKLKTIDLRAQWPHEALSFTKWLAQPENLELLSDEVGIGIDFTSVQIEAPVGRYSVDILTQEENTGRKIVIENQLEASDHQHVGQLITYAAVLEAEYIVWIVREARDEHKQAVEWLNERTDDHANFFLVQVELWQIEDSAPAPKFNIIVRPNEWVKSVRGSVQEGGLTDTKTLQLEFWQQLQNYAGAKGLKLRKPHPQHWYDMAIGRSDCHVTFTLSTSDESIGCELYIPDNKALFETFLNDKEDIERELGLQGSLSWQPLPNKKASRIRAFHAFQANSDDWEKGFEWLFQMGSKFKKVFGKTW